MSPRRRNRLFTMLVMVFSLLSMQFAVAAYACPGDSPRAAQIAAMADAGMPCAESMAAAMDEAQPGLCHAHCQTEYQSADNYQLPALLAPTQWTSAIRPLWVGPLPVGTPAQAPLLVRSTAPPLAIRHCCFRI